MKYQAVVHDSISGNWRYFSCPLKVYSCNELDNVKETLNEIEKHTADGLWAVGFVSYEAAPAFDQTFQVKNDNFPKIWFAIYPNSKLINLPYSSNNFFLGPWTPEISRDCYMQSVDRIIKRIKRGDTYQANYTFNNSAVFRGNPYDCFLAFAESQPTSYAAYIECGEIAICSCSPELFMLKSGSLITAKPMKGTAERKAEIQEDLSASSKLASSEKERAENIMIVDMIRNDLSRIASDNTVRPVSLFDVEAFRTVWQMTSTVEAHSNKSLYEIFEALFPCASITGAPKCSTMNILADEEKSPRRIYSGAIGMISPEQPLSFQFSVAIRTIVINKSEQKASYGVGSGITFDSRAESEFEECRLKCRATPNISADLKLLESMRWDKRSGFFMLEAHLDRMSKSALYFGFKFDKNQIYKQLELASLKWPGDILKIRMLLSYYGELKIEFSEFRESNKKIRVAISQRPVSSDNIYLYHKTTRRDVYTAALNDNPGFDDVILWNENEEITESCIANLLFRIKNNWYTPPLQCGLLNGTFRQRLISEGSLQEKNISLNDLCKADDIALVNSVRGWIKNISIDFCSRS